MQWFWTRAILSPREHLANPETFLVVTTGVCYWHLMGRDEMLLSILHRTVPDDKESSNLKESVVLLLRNLAYMTLDNASESNLWFKWLLAMKNEIIRTVSFFHLPKSNVYYYCYDLYSFHSSLLLWLSLC